jgi:hypothetical protein
MSIVPSAMPCRHSAPLAQSWVPMNSSTSIAPFEALLDIVLEDDEAVIVLVVLVGVRGGAQRDVGGTRGQRRPLTERCRSQRFDVSFQHGQCSSLGPWIVLLRHKIDERRSCQALPTNP